MILTSAVTAVASPAPKALNNSTIILLTFQQRDAVKMKLPKEIVGVLNRLDECGFEAYVVGGAVRDCIMGRACHDYDITTSALPEQIEKAFEERRVIETGIKHGTVTVLAGDYSVEITAYRCDGTYSDGRRPDSVSFTSSLEEDLKRRDFTVNAIAYNEKEGFKDFYGGMNDIKNSVIRCVGDAKERFCEDKLRILRVVRFSSCLGFDVEENTKKAVHEMCGQIECVSRERVLVELLKLLCGENVFECLDEYRDVFFEIIPELRAEDGFDQNNPNHCFALYEHTINCVKNTPPVPQVRLAALLHDIGKPETKTTDEYGVSHFKCHPDIGEKKAREILKRLKASGELTSSVCTLVKYHDVRFECDKKMIKRFLGKIGKDAFFELADIQLADVLSQSPEYSFRKEKLGLVRELATEICKNGESLCVADLKINGNDVINVCGVTGKAVGEILKNALNDVIDEKIDNNQETLMEYLRGFSKSKR